MQENLALEGTLEGVFWRDRTWRQAGRAYTVYVAHCPVTGVAKTGYRGPRVLWEGLGGEPCGISRESQRPMREALDAIRQEAGV